MRQLLKSLSDIKALGIDLDGVVYSGNVLMPYARESIETFRALGKSIYFITNNSSKNRSEIANKLNDLGVQASEEEIYSSGYATAVFVKSIDTEAEVFVVGSDGLKNEFDKLSIKISAHPVRKYLIVGFDRFFTYDKIAQAYDMIHQGAIFIACNRDKSFPVECGKSMPACNAMIAAIESTTGKSPDYVIGKPETFIINLIAQKYNYSPQEILIIGDTPEIDIAMANRFGSPSILITEKAHNRVLPEIERASLVVQSMDQIVNLLVSC